MEQDEESDEYHAVLELGGSPYWLVAVRTIGGYHAASGCDRFNEAHRCGLYNEASEGLHVAKERATEHHGQFHRAPAKPK
jgi:hypothetical protein